MTRLVSGLFVVVLAIMTVGWAQGQMRTDGFDYEVRSDMFKGIAGDAAAFERAMAVCEARLAVNPDHAEALVWHGTGLIFRAGEAFRNGDRNQGAALNQQAISEMAKAVTLRPNDVAVLIPRGAVMLAAGMFAPDPARGRPYIETAVDDFEKVLVLQQPYFQGLPAHPKGELLAGLAEGWWRLGEAQKSREYLTRIIAEMPDTKYAAAAKTRLDNPAGNSRVTCLGCHTK
ncbi:MAG: hypothetical protein QOD40_1358 [Alphaproteobacteria bacterium]|jgi:tetratricopeptide (TPR) repeat protein|nr:hypothetical protein [Alphaproteobacteria bacterium]